MLTVLIPEEGESWGAFARRISQMQEQMLVVLSGGEETPSLSDEEGMRDFFAVCAGISDRLLIASRKRGIVTAARSRGIRVVSGIRDLKDILEGHPSALTVLRLLTPNVWRQQLRSRLQTMGLLSLPKIRIWLLIFVSALLLFFVLFRLLPSASVRIWPRGDTISQTANIFLVQSGAIISSIPARVRTMELIPLTVHVKRSITFDQISKKFIGTSSQLAMTVRNTSSEPYSLRKGTRLTNQAGMVFHLEEQAIVAPGEEVTVPAKASDLDLYGEIIGDRGNVPAGLKWDFPGLAPEERVLVYGENREEGSGGTTAYETVLSERDLEIAEKQLQQELLAMANQLVDENRTLENAQHPERVLDRLYYDELTTFTYSGFILPTQFINEKVSSVPVEGGIIYTAFAYDKKYALDMLASELHSHVADGKKLMTDSILLDHLVHHVIDYADDLSWIKLTVDLTARERFILDPLTPAGARFGMQIRNQIAGISVTEALRIIKNLPEVENAEISLWPPWGRTLPTIPSHIAITAEDE
ncbi:MAG: hypothetical protein V1926_04025 [Candidatus Peregrinibacteria bacterium]